MQTETLNATERTAASGGCGESASIKLAAGELYQTAVLLVGIEDTALRLVEESVSAVEVDPCAEGDAARDAVQHDVIRRSLREITGRMPAAMQPPAIAELSGCVDSEADISREHFEALFAGPGRARVRQWLDGLAPAERSIFVLRAVLRRTGAETAALLSEVTGEEWGAPHVGAVYRTALCSLASSMAHSAA